VIGDPTYADAILDWLVHNVHRIGLEGDSMRRASCAKPLDYTLIRLPHDNDDRSRIDWAESARNRWAPSSESAAGQDRRKDAPIEPGSPWENGYCENFNGKLRDELLNGRSSIRSGKPRS